MLSAMNRSPLGVARIARGLCVAAMKATLTVNGKSILSRS
jgi:hypothetical protein